MSVPGEMWIAPHSTVEPGHTVLVQANCCVTG